MTEKNFTFKKIIIELGEIKLIYAPNMPEKYRLLNPITKKQREILENLGFDAAIIKTTV